ncbi:MAG TPA: polysaccharide lyase family 7 protein, partial [Kribbella sp.]
MKARTLLTAVLVLVPSAIMLGPASGAVPAGTSAGTLEGTPAGVLELTNWKLTLPTGSEGKPAEVKQPELADYAKDPYFVVEGKGVRFRAPVDGVTTSGSSYPRSELREMTNDGQEKADWSSTSGTHTLIV